ncbi:MAG: hypothetical protein E6Q88_04455 [Lysobacteraceae bacterium]|nr:MAG: hypothetical protein E6Q88_04455 [Xanthomonadaceae bacterium]
MNADDRKKMLQKVKSVVAAWGDRSVKEIKVATKLADLRDGKLTALGLMLRARFDLDHGPDFDETLFDAMWRSANIVTVEHCYWLVDMAFTSQTA